MHEIERLAELAELANEAAMSELGAFGFIGFEPGVGRMEPDENAAAWSMFLECAEYVPLGLY